MWKILVVAGALLCFIGCSNGNELCIINDAYGTITVNFRANLDTMYSATRMTIKDIPNGVFISNATYWLPGALYTGGAMPTIPPLPFKRDNTRWTLYFTSVIAKDYTYSVFLNATTSDGTTITSP
jgi:hypothetical protein